MAPLILRALRGLYKINILYVDNSEEGDANSRTITQKKCRLKGYCYMTENPRLHIYDKGLRSDKIIEDILQYLNDIPGILATRTSRGQSGHLTVRKI